MVISRRDSLAGILAGSAAAGLMACESQQNKTTENPKNSAIPPLPKSPTSLLLNQTRAAEIMEQEKIDLIICANPINIYYLTNQRPMTYRLGMNDFSYATLSSKPLAPPCFITGRYDLYMGGALDTNISDLLNFRMASFPANPEAFAKLTEPNDIINAPAFEGFYPRLHDNHKLPYHVQNRRDKDTPCLLYTSPSPRDATLSRMPSSA